MEVKSCEDVLVSRKSFEPLNFSQRVASIDLLRGVALLGILIINIQSFAMVRAAYMNPGITDGFHGINRLTWILTETFASGKFFPIFSMLFGAGVVLMTSKIEKTGKKSRGLHYSRNLWLIFFGCLHGYLFWYGDILYGYGMCSLFIYFFRKLSPVKLMVAGLLILLVSSGLSVHHAFTLDSMPKETLERINNFWSPSKAEMAEELNYMGGDWKRQMVFRVPRTLGLQTYAFIMFILWEITGFMLMGMALFKWGVFSCSFSTNFYWKGLLFTLPLGLIMVVWSVFKSMEVHFSYGFIKLISRQVNSWGSMLMTFGYICIVMLICKLNKLKKLSKLIQKSGNMALSNYLFQTVICTFIFYGGVGLGLIGKLQRWEQQVAVILIWMVILLFSSFWLKRFNFGPLEWVWRSLSYGKIQKLKK